MNRRELIKKSLTFTAVGAAAASFSSLANAANRCQLTPAQTEGPFFKAGSPGRADLVEPGSKARVVELTGFVLTRGCNPVARAVVDLWHADEHGAYEYATCGGKLVNRVGTSGADKLKGTSASDGILALDGKDTLKGLAGKDGLCGGNGKDKLNGGGGKDKLIGGKGNDVCNGGAGKDTTKSC